MVRYVRKVRFKKQYFIYNFQKWEPGNTGKKGKISYIGYKLSFFLLQRLTPSNVGKICKKGNIKKNRFLIIFKSWGPGNNGRTGKKGKISYMGYKSSFFQKI